MTDVSVATPPATTPAQAPLPLASWTLADALAEKIRDHLVHGRISQRAFGRALGVSQGSVSYLLSARRRQDTLDFCERLATVFGQAPSELFRELEGRVAGRRVFVSFLTPPTQQPPVQPVKEPPVIRVHAEGGGESSHAARRALSDRSTIEEQLASVTQQLEYLQALRTLLLQTQYLREENGAVLGSITTFTDFLRPPAPGAPLPAGVPPSGQPVGGVATDHRQAPAAGAAERRRSRRHPRQRRTPAR
jgi:transcriptional regulator with XRE-family HTH domain